MTNTERAEKIYQYLLKPDSSLSFADPTEYITSQLDEAVKEGSAKAVREAYEKGFADGTYDGKRR